MKKLFWSLVIVSFLGSGVLLYLIKKMPEDSHEVSAEGSHEELEDAEQGSDEHHGEESDGHHENDSGVQHEQAASEGADHEKSGDHAEASHDSLQKIFLRLKTEPSGASIYIDESYMGNSPADIPLRPESQKLRLEKEGFAALEEVIPSESQSNNQDLHWALKLSPAPKNADSIPLLTGKQGPAFVQVKAVPWVQFEAARYDLGEASAEGLVGCKVEIKNKGTWVRLLKGPFLAAYAKGILEKHQREFPGSFVTGEQICLK